MIILVTLITLYDDNPDNPDNPDNHILGQAQPFCVVHCDIKPENILLRTPQLSSIKLIDFGSSCITTDPMHSYIQSR